MRKKTKLLFIILFITFLLLFSINKVFAVNLNTIDDEQDDIYSLVTTNLNENNEENEDDEPELTNSRNSELDDQDDEYSNVNLNRNTANTTKATNETNTSVSSNPQVQVTSTQNEKAGLSFEGIATIILIAIGVVLIFLAIAILIRCK